MAISSISIIQSNIINDVNLIAAHSDVFFIAEAIYSGLTPTSLGVAIYDKEDVLLKNFRAVTKGDTSVTTREFYFESGVLIRALMPLFDDFFQGSNTILKCTNLDKIIKIKFYDLDNEATFSETITVNFAHAVRQIAESVGIEDVFLNFSKTVFCVKDRHCYLYYYNSEIGTNLSVLDETQENVLSSVTCNEIGLYRYKETFTESKKRYFSDDGGEYLKDIKVLDVCENGKEIKYLDKNGFYRFFGFTQFFETKDAPRKIGNVLKNFYDIQTAQSRTQNLGTTNTPQMSLFADVSNEQLEILKDVNNSPRIYLRVDSTGDNFKNWIEVERKSGTNDTNRPHQIRDRYTLNLNLPKSYTITML